MSKSKNSQTHNTQLPKQNNLLGMVYMSIHVLALAILYAAVKKLTVDVDSSIVVFLYKFAILIIILPWCLAGGLESMKTKRIKLHFARGFFSVFGSLCMFHAIKHIDLPDVTAVQYLEHVIMLIIGIVVFKEKAHMIKFVVIALSFIGALMIVRPDLFEAYPIAHGNSVGFNPYYIFVFMALGFWATNSTMIKILGRTEKTKVQLFYTTVFSCMFAFPIAFMKWQTFATLGAVELKYPSILMTIAETKLSTHHFNNILLLAVCYLIHAITHFKAFKHAELSVIIPLEYTRLIYAGILGYMFFNDSPSMMKLIGYSFIILAGLLMLDFEHKKLAKAKAKEKELLKEEYND